jgi:hypothetical protein
MPMPGKSPEVLGQEIWSGCFRLPFPARWMHKLLQPGTYRIVFIAAGAKFVTTVYSQSMAAMMAPMRLRKAQALEESTIVLRTTGLLPQVHSLRLAAPGLELHFEDEAPGSNVQSTVLPLREIAHTCFSL